MATLANVNQPVRLAHERLLQAAAEGDLATLCDDHHLDLFVVFGSVLVPGADPGDLDVAAQIAAIMERLDTDRFRAMELELMSS